MEQAIKTAALLALCFAGCAHLSAAAPLETSESAPQPGVHVTSRTVHFAVRGHSIRELAAEMRRIGPIDDGGHRYAHTWGTYAWRYPYQQLPNGCLTGPVKVELEIVQTFPEWVAPASGADLAEWTRWQSAIEAHEDGHRKILLATAEKIVRQLGGIDARAACADLDKAANDLGGELIAEMRREHADYDRDTKHGTLTGAALREEPR